MLKKDLGLFFEDAIEKNDEKLVKRLIEGKADLTHKYENNNEVLHLAMGPTKRNSNIVKMLLEAKADPVARNITNNRPVYSAKENINENYWACLKVFAEILKNQVTPLSCALLEVVVHNHFNTTKILLNAGAENTWSHPTDGYPLYFAVKNQNATMIFLLLEFGADPERKIEDPRGKTPIALVRELSFYDGIRAFAAHESFQELRQDLLRELKDTSWKTVEKNLLEKLSRVKTFSDTVLGLHKANKDAYYTNCHTLINKYLSKLIELGDEELYISINDDIVALFKSRTKENNLKIGNVKEESRYPNLFGAAMPPSAPPGEESDFQPGMLK